MMGGLVKEEDNVCSIQAASQKKVQMWSVRTYRPIVFNK